MTRLNVKNLLSGCLSATMLLVLSSCIYVQRYPADWQPPVTGSEECPSIAGKYTDEGETADRSRILLEKLISPLSWSTSGYLPVGRIEIEQPDSSIIKVTAWSYAGNNMGDVAYSRQRGDFACESGWVVFDRPAHRTVNKFILGTEWGENRFGKGPDGYLIARSDMWGFGLFAFIPVVETGRMWYRFKPDAGAE